MLAFGFVRFIKFTSMVWSTTTFATTQMDITWNESLDFLVNQIKFLSDWSIWVNHGISHRCGQAPWLHLCDFIYHIRNIQFPVNLICRSNQRFCEITPIVWDPFIHFYCDEKNVNKLWNKYIWRGHIHFCTIFWWISIFSDWKSLTEMSKMTERSTKH